MQIKFIDRKTGQIKQETPPAEGLLKFLYDNPFGKTAFLPLARRKFISAWYGRKMNKPSSVKKIQDFIDTHGINMEEYEGDVPEFTSFNDFFYRKLKPGARSIESGFVSPGDGRLLAFESVSDLKHFFVKGHEFTLPKFLNDAQLARKYANASLFILRLAPNDYHRFHFPYAGTPSEVTKINGKYYSVSPHALANNFVKVFCENKREYCTLKSQDKGDILLVPVGATMVGTVIETYSPGQQVAKGDEMGYFAFGGSTVAVLVDREKIQIDADILQNTRNKLETYVQLGDKIGV